MGNNIKEFYLNAVSNFHKPIKSTKRTFNIKDLSTKELKNFKKIINAELKSRRKSNINTFWQKHKKSIYAIATLVVAIIGTIIIPVLLSK